MASELALRIAGELSGQGLLDFNFSGVDVAPFIDAELAEVRAVVAGLYQTIDANPAEVPRRGNHATR